MDLGQAIKALRAKKGMTQEQLAARCGMSITGGSLIEMGKRTPSTATIEQLCKAFDIPVTYLFLQTIEEEDFPDDKRVLYRALLEPLRNELIQARS